MARLIDADALLKWLEECTDEKDWLVSQYNADWIYSMLESAPTVDVVPTAAYEQVRWERDMAMKQLEEHGIPFGGVAPDVVEVRRCKDCEFFDETGYEDVNAEIDMPELHAGYCSVWKQVTQACGYCSYGERREGE